MQLYLLKFKKFENVFKIGISVNLQSRIRTLCSTWGELDFDNSYMVSSHKGDKAIKNLERELHMIFKIDEEFQINHKGKDGYSEFRLIEHFYECLDIINNQKHPSFGYVCEPVIISSVDTKQEPTIDTIKNRAISLVTQKKLDIDYVSKYFSKLKSLVDKSHLVESNGKDLITINFDKGAVFEWLSLAESCSNTVGIVFLNKYKDGSIKKIVLKTITKFTFDYIIVNNVQIKMRKEISQLIRTLNVQVINHRYYNQHTFIIELEELLNMSDGQCEVYAENQDYILFHLTFEHGIDRNLISSFAIREGGSISTIGFSSSTHNKYGKCIKCGVILQKQLNTDCILEVNGHPVGNLTHGFVESYENILTLYKLKSTNTFTKFIEKYEF